jgi:hypothetical protein
MSSKTPYRINEINVDNICYTDIKTSERKTIIYLKYMDCNKLKNIVFQTPNLVNAFNIVKKNSIYELDIPLKGKSEGKTMKLVNFFNSIDKKIMKDAKNNSTWFAGFHQQQTMKYQKIIRDSVSSEYSNGIIRIKILNTNDFNTIVSVNEKKIESYDSIPENCWVKSILEIYAIWINENGFGLFIRPILVNFKLSETIIYDYKLIDDSEEEVDDVDDGLCTIQDNNDSVFIRSENDIDTVLLDMSDFKKDLTLTELKNNLENDLKNDNETEDTSTVEIEEEPLEDSTSE